MNEWVRIARLSRTRNLEGSLVAQSCDGLPFLLEPGQHVRFAPPTLKGPRSGCISQVTQIKPDAWEVAFDGVEGIEDAQQLVGSFCLVRSDTLGDISHDDAIDEWKNLHVEDVRAGTLGTVSDVVDNPMQSLLVVDGPYGQVLIPLVDEFISSVEDNTVFVDLPDGLVELGHAQ